MIKKLYPENPNSREIDKIVKILQDGGTIIYPTDTVYGLGCDIFNHKAVEYVATIKGLKLNKANFSVICYDLSHLSDYARQVDNNTFKLMKKLLPGPYTFILNASSKVPRFFTSKKKTIGIRIPDNNIILEIVKKLDHPILTTSIHREGENIEYLTDPELIHEKYKDIVNLVIDGGSCGTIPSTIIDCTGFEPEVVRMGAGKLEF